MIFHIILEARGAAARLRLGSSSPMRRGAPALLALSLAGLAVATAWHPVPGPPATRATVSPSTCAEDEPCFDWRTMGNLERGVCIDDVDWLEHADPFAPYDLRRRTYTLGGRGCEALSDDQRPVCWAEPSATPERVEVIWYPHLADVEPGNPGFEVLCP